MGELEARIDLLHGQEAAGAEQPLPCANLAEEAIEYLSKTSNLELSVLLLAISTHPPECFQSGYLSMPVIHWPGYQTTSQDGFAIISCVPCLMHSSCRSSGIIHVRVGGIRFDERGCSLPSCGLLQFFLENASPVFSTTCMAPYLRESQHSQDTRRFASVLLRQTLVACQSTH